jgi:predicted DNA-binding protein (UPF0251 family)
MLYNRLSTQKINKILLCFCEDITASSAAKLVKVNRKTVNNYYNDLREKILKEQLIETAQKFCCAKPARYAAPPSCGVRFGCRRV